MSGRNIHPDAATVLGNFPLNGGSHEGEAAPLPNDRLDHLTPHQRKRVGHIPALQRRSERRSLRLRCFAVAFGLSPAEDVLGAAEAVLAWVEHGGAITQNERLEFLDVAAQKECGSVHELLAIAADIEAFVVEGDDA